MKRPAKIKAGTVVLLDSIGELASVYALASVAFVGGSLIPEGGHNPLEPAQFAVPVVMGTYYPNFRAIIDTLVYAEALKLATTETLVPILENLLTDDEAANTLGSACARGLPSPIRGDRARDHRAAGLAAPAASLMTPLLAPLRAGVCVAGARQECPL